MEFLIFIGAAAIFLLFVGLASPKSVKREVDVSKATYAHYRARSIGKNKMFDGIADTSIRRALRKDSTNDRYLKLLKQANWFWEPGEPAKPNPKAPFWNVETMWGEKIFGALLFSMGTTMMLLMAGILFSIVLRLPVIAVVGACVGVGLALGLFAFQLPDSNVASAAVRRQRELSLEMGYRIPEIRSDVLAGNTIQRAMRNLSVRPGGPFVEEIRRAVTILDITKDDTLAMDQLIDRNEGNELVAEFANSVKMVSRQGGQIGPVLSVLADQAQQHLRISIQAQARRNLQEMARPVGLGSLLVTSLLIILPAIAGVIQGVGQLGQMGQ
jgi:Flp pilus assembly protein TadB